MKHIKKISNYAMVGGLGAMLIVGLVGCEDKGQNQQQKADALNQGQKNGAFVIIEESAAGGYTIVDEFPSKDTRIVLRQADGSERILSQREIDILVQEENVKIENGTSALTNPEQAQVSGGGMGLGGVLMSSIAGAMIGSWIGGKLFNNQNYKNQRAAQYKSPSTYSRSKNSFAKAKAASTRSASSKKSGFFGGGKKSTAKRSFFGG
ncbi:hypothetical protein DZA31_00620 [Arcobacter sp. HD9-500m-PIT-SAG02]|nr:hypothetical protein DZA31_00620 [Arcobacter sp. HD9-500m-PIT-SAG02]